MRQGALGVIFLTVALDLIGFAMVVPLAPLYARHFGATGGQQTLLFAVYSLMQLLFAPLWGRLSDRVGRRPVLLASIAGNVVALAAYALAGSYAALLAARAVAGLCAANIAVAQAYIADVTPASQRARGMGLVGAAFGIGFVVGPFVGGEMSQFGLAAPAWLAAGIGVVNLLGAGLLLRETLPPAARVQRPGGGLWAARLAPLGRSPVLRRLLGLSFLQGVGFAMMEVALVLFAQTRMRFEARQVGHMFAGIGLLLALVQGGLVGRLARRLGEVRLVQLGLATTTCGMWLTPASQPGALVVLVAALILLTCGQGMAGPGLASLVSRQADRGAQGGTLGIGQSVASLARVVGPLATGIALDRGGEAWPFWFGGAAVAAAAAWAAVRLGAVIAEGAPGAGGGDRRGRAGARRGGGLGARAVADLTAAENGAPAPVPPIQVCLVGGQGRLGGRIAALLARQPGWRHHASLVRPGAAGDGVRTVEMGPGPAPTTRLEDALAGAHLVMDVTAPAACQAVAPACAERRLPLLVASTGLAEPALRALALAGSRAAVLHAPNLSRQVALLVALVGEARRRLAGTAAAAAVWDLHHAEKRDAPSGTGRALAAAAGVDPTAVLSARLGDIPGEHRVVLAGAGEALELGHRCWDRDVFARGALEAAAWLIRQPPGLYGVADWVAGDAP